MSYLIRLEQRPQHFFKYRLLRQIYIITSGICSSMGLQITHLQGLPTLTRLPSPHMQLCTLMVLFRTMGPQILSELMPFIIEKIFASWTRVQIVFNHDSWLENTDSIPLTPAKICGISVTVHALMQTIVGNSPILICPDMTGNFLSQGVVCYP